MKRPTVSTPSIATALGGSISVMPAIVLVRLVPGSMDNAAGDTACVAGSSVLLMDPTAHRFVSALGTHHGDHAGEFQGEGAKQGGPRRNVFG